MNGDDRLRRLFAAARESEPDTAQVEYGFETRLLARLRAERARPALWAAWTWRLIPAFAAVVLALGLWNFAAPAVDGSDLATALTRSSEQDLVAYFTGE
jgi:hypothetical protein